MAFLQVADLPQKRCGYDCKAAARLHDASKLPSPAKAPWERFNSKSSRLR
jgi:hypothetical protein